MPEKEEQKDAATQVVDLLKKQDERLGGIETGIKEVKDNQVKADERLTTVEGQLKKGAPEYKDDVGKHIAGPWVTSGPINKDSQPLMITNIVRALKAEDWGLAKEERAVNDELRKMGYVASTMGGILFPLAPEHIPDEFAEQRSYIAKRLTLEAVDYGEIAWLCKRYPSIAKAFDLMYKDLKLGDDTLGGFLVPIVQADRVIDLLRNRVVVQRAGATEIALPPSGNITWPKATSDPSFSYGDPDRTADIGITDATFGALRFTAKQLSGAIAIPNDLIRFSSPSVEVVVRQMMAARAAVVEDAAYLQGLGTSFEPKGVLNHDTSLTPGTPGKVTLHVAATVNTNGDTFEPEDVANMVAKHEESNDPDGPTAWIMRPLLWAAIINRRADAAVAGDKKGPFIFPVTRGDAGRMPEKRLLDIPVLTTKQSPNDRVKGSGTDLSVIFLANWRRAIIARSGTMELAASEHVRFLRDQTVIKGILRSDFGLEFEESFVLVDDLLVA